MPTSPYPYATGKDPEFDAFRAKYDYSKFNAQADADQRRRKAEEDYASALKSLELQGTAGRTNLDTSMLSRGVYKSGETHRRRGELESTLLQGRAAADTGKANALGQVSADLQRAFTGLDLDYEQAYSAALARVKTGSGGGGGSGGGVSKSVPIAPVTPTPGPRWPSLTFTQPGPKKVSKTKAIAI